MTSKIDGPGIQKTALNLPQTDQIIGELYQESVAHTEKELKEHSWLRNGHPLGNPVEIDWKLGALLLGDGHIAGTPLEGYDTKKSVAFFKDTVGHLIAEAKKGEAQHAYLNPYLSKLERFRDDMHEAQSIAEMMHKIAQEGLGKTEEQREKLLDEYAEKLLLTFREKKVGWIPCGWVTKNGESHAMMAHVDMKGKVTIVNTGGGVIENHACIKTIGKDPLTGQLQEALKAQEFVTFTDVSKDRLRDKALFRFFLELQTRPSWDGQLDFSAENIYQPLKKYLKGKEESPLSPFSHPKAYKKPQRSGTCAIKSVSTTLYYMLTDSFNGGGKNEKKAVQCYKKINYEWKTQALVGLGNLVDGSITESQRLLLDDLMANVSRSAEKLYKEKLLGADDLKGLNATIEDIKEKLAKVKVVSDEIEPSAPVGTGLAPDSLSAVKNVAIKVDNQDLSKKSSLWGVPSKAHAAKETGIDLFLHELSTAKDTGKQTQLQSIATLLKQFEAVDTYDFKQEFKGLNKENRKAVREALLSHLAGFVGTLQVPEAGGNNFWSGLPSHQAVPAMEQVTALLNLIVKVHMLKENDWSWDGIKHSADLTAMNYILLAINDQIARTLPETKLKGFEVSHWDLLFEMKSPHFVIKDAALQKRLAEVVAYFNPDFSLDELMKKTNAKGVKEKYNALFGFKRDMYADQFQAGQLSLKEKEFEKDVTARYFLQFLKEIQGDPAKRQQLYASGRVPTYQNGVYSYGQPQDRPLSSSDSILEHLVALMGEKDGPNSLLPKSVRLLQQSALLCASLHYTKFDGQAYFDKGGNFEFKTRQTSEKPAVYQVEASPWDQGWDYHTYSDIQDKHLHKFDYSALVQDQEERKLQNQFVVRQRLHFDQGLDVSRELEMIGVDPYDEVARATAFLKKHLNLLKVPEVQQALEMHLFKFGRLDAQLKAEPALAAELSNTLHLAIKHYQHLEEVETCLLLAKLGQDLKVYVEQAGVNAAVQDFRAVILDEVLPQFRDDLSAKFRCYETLVGFYSKIQPAQLASNEKLKKSMIHDVLGLSVFRAVHGDFLNKEFDGGIRAAQLKMMPLVREALKSGMERDAVLNSLVKLVHPNAADHNWSGSFPEFANEKYLFNVSEGTIIDKEGGQFSYIPQKILQNDLFKKIYKHEIISCEKKEDGQTYIINAGLPNEIIVRDAAYTLEFQRKIDGVDYRYVDTPGFLTHQGPTLIDQHSHCWVHNGKDPEMVVFNQEGKRVLLAKLKKQDWGFSGTAHYSVESVHQYDAAGTVIKSSAWVPFDTVSKDLQLLAGIELDKNYIECWADATQGDKLAALKIPRLGLSFKAKTLKGKSRLYSEQFPGYFLVKNPQVDALAKTERFLTLENAAGERKILLPKVRLDVQFQGKPFDRKITQTMNVGFSWMEFELKQSGLYSKKVEAQLYQIYLLLARGDYAEAAKVLERTTPLDRLSDDVEEGRMEKTLLRWILSGLENDRHPSGKALFLKLAAMIHHNNLKYPLPINGKPEDPCYNLEALGEAYQAYYLNQSNTTACRLSEKEELVIFEQLTRGIEEALKNAKANKDIVAIAMLNQKKKMVDVLWGERGNYLKTGRTKIGARTFVVPQMPKENPQASLEDLKKRFEEYVKEGGTPLPGFLIQDEKYFEKEFFGLYRIARSGSKEEKEKLNKMLDLSSAATSAHLGLLKSVAAHPGRYPTYDKLLEVHTQKVKMDAALANIKSSDYPTYNEYWKARDVLYKDREKALKAEDAAFKKILPTQNFFTRIAAYVKKMFRMISGVFLGKFSLGTMLYQEIALRFRSTYKRPVESTKKQEKTPVRCDGKALHKADKAFDQYFQTLVDKYFEVKEVPVKQSGDKLPAAHENKNIAKKLKAENEELEAFHEMQAETEKVYVLKEGVKLESLKSELAEKAKHITTNLKAQKAALLWQLNDIPEQTKERSLKATHDCGFHKRLTWEDLRDLTLDGNLEAFQKKTHLTRPEAERLMSGVSDFLIKSSRLDQMRSAIGTIEKAAALKSKKRAGTYLQYIPKAMLAFRAYKPDTSNLSKQWFEAANHYHYRSLQLQKLQEFTDPAHDEIQAEAPTGFGKTKNIIPNLNYMKSQEGRLVVNTWPASLEMQNASDAKEQMELSFGKKVDRFHFDRASAFTTESLAHVYKEMLLDKEQGRPINIRSEALRSLELHTLLFLKQAKQNQGKVAELKKQIGYLLKILRLIRTEAWTTIDEEHINLDPMDKLIYTLGDSYIMPSDQIDFLEELFVMLSSGAIGDLLKLNENQQSLLKPEEFEAKIAPQLADAFMEKFGIGHFNRQSFQDFVLGNSSSIPKWLEKHPKREMIALAKGMVSQVLKSSLKGAVDETYGLSKCHIKSKEYAIPYASANTPKESKQNPSQYKNPHETMVKTYMTYLYKGLTEDQFSKFINFLKDLALEETKEGGSLADTEANKFFKTIAPKSTKYLNTLKQADIDALYPELFKNQKVLFYYIRYIVVPQLKIYPESLVSTVHNFRAQFPSSLSLSATPQDKNTHGPDTHFIPMKGTAGQVTHLLLTKCKDPAALHEIVHTKPAEALEESLDIVKDNPRIHATIDIGANFKGLSNLEVANKMRAKLQSKDDVQAILFFDEKDGLFKIMDAATGQVHDPSESKLEPEYVQTFYDQSRCFGSDVKQAIDAVGLLMTGKGTTKANAGQGAGRMRLLHNGQSVEVAYPKVLKKEIFGANEPNIKQLLVYWLVNEVKNAEDKNYQSQLQQMDNEIRRTLMDKIEGITVGAKPKLATQEPDVEKAIALFSKWEKEFFGVETCDPWNMYAPIPEDRDTIECLKEYQTSCLNKVKKLSRLSKAEKRHVTNRLKTYSDKWKEMILPESVKANSPGLGIDCEVLQEIEVEAEIEIQAHVKEDIQERTPAKWPESLDLFKPGWEKPKHQSIFLKKIGNAMTRWLPKHPVAKVFAATAIGLAIAAVATTAMAIAGVAMPIIAGVGAGLAVLGIGYAVFALLWNRNFSKGNPIYRVKDLMNLYLPSRVSKSSMLFSPNLLVSNNFYVQQTQAVAETPQKPFNVEQKPIFSVVVILDEHKNGSKDFKMMVIDQNDSPFFHKKLEKDVEEAGDIESQARTRKVGIYDIGNGMFTAQGKNRFEEEDLNDHEFLKLVAQVKFLNGEVNYSSEEIAHFGPHMEMVAKKVGHGPLQRLFENHILQFHPMNRKSLHNKLHPKPIAKLLGFVAPQAAFA